MSSFFFVVFLVHVALGETSQCPRCIRCKCPPTRHRTRARDRSHTPCHRRCKVRSWLQHFRRQDCNIAPFNKKNNPHGESLHSHSCAPRTLHSCAPRTYPLATTEQRYLGTTFRKSGGCGGDHDRRSYAPANFWRHASLDGLARGHGKGLRHDASSDRGVQVQGLPFGHAILCFPTAAIIFSTLGPKRPRCPTRSMIPCPTRPRLRPLGCLFLDRHADKGASLSCQGGRPFRSPSLVAIRSRNLRMRDFSFDCFFTSRMRRQTATRLSLLHQALGDAVVSEVGRAGCRVVQNGAFGARQFHRRDCLWCRCADGKDDSQ